MNVEENKLVVCEFLEETVNHGTADAAGDRTWTHVLTRFVWTQSHKAKFLGVGRGA